MRCSNGRCCSGYIRHTIGRGCKIAEIHTAQRIEVDAQIVVLGQRRPQNGRFDQDLVGLDVEYAENLFDFLDVLLVVLDNEDIDGGEVVSACIRITGADAGFGARGQRHFAFVAQHRLDHGLGVLGCYERQVEYAHNTLAFFLEDRFVLSLGVDVDEVALDLVLEARASKNGLEGLFERHVVKVGRHAAGNLFRRDDVSSPLR